MWFQSLDVFSGGEGPVLSCDFPASPEAAWVLAEKSKERRVMTGLNDETRGSAVVSALQRKVAKLASSTNVFSHLSAKLTSSPAAAPFCCTFYTD